MNLTEELLVPNLALNTHSLLDPQNPALKDPLAEKLEN